MSQSAHIQALNLAGDLPGLVLDARRLAAHAPGLHGRRVAGQGESFWQYREHQAEDGARLVDWRRSARGDRFYVREREREAAQTAWFWVDPGAGMDWSSSSELPSKRASAMVLLLALAIVLARAGERIGVLGETSRAGPRAGERLAHDLIEPPHDVTPPRLSAVIYASDFYAPIEHWRVRLADAAHAGARGALLMIADPAEEDFPFSGRTLFTSSDGRDEALIGRAESAREAYAQKLSDHRRALRAMAAAHGFPAVLHRTDAPAGPALSLLMALMSERR